jgi:hypothetical protein
VDGLEIMASILHPEIAVQAAAGVPAAARTPAPAGVWVRVGGP